MINTEKIQARFNIDDIPIDTGKVLQPAEDIAIFGEISSPQNKLPDSIWGDCNCSVRIPHNYELKSDKVPHNSKYIPDIAAAKKKKLKTVETSSDDASKDTTAERKNSEKRENLPVANVISKGEPFNQEVVFDGRKINMQLVESKLDDGSSIIEGEIKTPEGTLKYKKSTKKNGAFYEEILHKYQDGSSMLEYTREEDNTSITDKSWKRIEGREYRYTDENGQEVITGSGKCYDKKTGSLEISSHSSIKDGVVEVFKDFYGNAGVYNGSTHMYALQEAEFVKVVNGTAYFDENNNYVFEPNSQHESYIQPPISSENKFSKDTSDFMQLTGLSTLVDDNSGLAEFPKFEFCKDNINTDPKVVEEKGEITTKMQYGTKTEFCKNEVSTNDEGVEVNEKIRGYTKKDENGRVLQEWKEVTDPESGDIKYTEQKIYDYETQKHYALRTYYNDRISSTLAQTVSHQYYIQGNDEAGITRYTRVMSAESGEMFVDYDNYDDFVQWDAKGTKTSMADIERTLEFGENS